MELALQFISTLCGFIVSKQVKIKNEMDRLDEIIKNEPDAELRKLHFATRRELSFEYNFDFKANPEDIDSLIEISNIPNVRKFQIRDAYRIWRSENGRIQTEIGRAKRTIGMILFNAGCTGFGISIFLGLLINFWTDVPYRENLLLTAVSCFFVSSLSTFGSIPFKQAEVVQKHIAEFEKTKSVRT